MENNILHIDMNNFYASVESIERPELRDVPMAVAGDSENRHGIILAKNQLAKGFGVQTAEVIWKAKQKCPGLLLISPHFEKYQYYSAKAREIYQSYTDRVESFGLDECWLDLAGCNTLFGSYTQIANEIRERIKNELQLTVSIGVSFTKTFAKLGNDYKKPDAVTLFSYENYKEKIWPMPAKELLFVGPNTAKTLARYGIHTIGDIACMELSVLRNILGKAGEGLYLAANGMDSREVSVVGVHEDAKSIGNSTTLPYDIKSEADVKIAFLGLADTVAGRLRKHGKRTEEIQITVRSNTFEEILRQVSLKASVCDTKSIYEAAVALYKKEKKNWEIRALGIRAGKLTEDETAQTSFFADDKEIKRREKLEGTVDNIRDKFGSDLIKNAALYKDNNLQEEEYPGFSQE